MEHLVEALRALKKRSWSESVYSRRLYLEEAINYLSTEKREQAFKALTTLKDSDLDDMWRELE